MVSSIACVDVAVRGEHVPGPDVEQRCRRGRDTAPPASSTIRRRGDVPRLEALFPEAVDAPGRDVAEVERRRPEPTHRARAADEGGEQPDDLVAVLVHVVRETR